VRGPEDFARISPGDVIVCATTTPAWGPAASEYGLPAVVGADAATRWVPDGALVRVEGHSGEVWILRPSPEALPYKTEEGRLGAVRPGGGECLQRLGRRFRLLCD
jgi:hypothetical protein